jgi:hypothetical protein
MITKHDYNPDNDSMVHIERLQVNGMYLVTFSDKSGCFRKMMCDTLEDAEFVYTEYLKMVQT